MNKTKIDLDDDLILRSENVEYDNDTLKNKLDTIVESGSNDDGNWIKFSNGTMICICSVVRNIANTTAWNNMFIGDILNIPFPQTFVELYSCNIDLYTTRNVWKMSGGIPSTSGTNTFYSISPESFTTDIQINVIAIGKWK